MVLFLFLLCLVSFCSVVFVLLLCYFLFFFFFFSSRRRHTRYWRDWSSDVCSSDLTADLDARARNPCFRWWLWIPGSLVSLAPSDAPIGASGNDIRRIVRPA